MVPSRHKHYDQKRNDGKVIGKFKIIKFNTHCTKDSSTVTKQQVSTLVGKVDGKSARIKITPISKYYNFPSVKIKR